MVRIPDSHSGGPGSIPGCGTFFLLDYFYSMRRYVTNNVACRCKQANRVVKSVSSLVNFFFKIN